MGFFSIGVNKKVGSDTAIMNITPAINCPARALGLCQLGENCNRCYALKAERIYPTARRHREQQTVIWDNNNVLEFGFMLKELMKKEHRDKYDKEKRKLKYVRFSEAGDFRTQADVEKLFALAEMMENKLMFYGYTARRDLNFSKAPDNVVINGSGFMVHNQFKIVNKIPANVKFKCNGNCRTCNLCKERNGGVIYVKLH